MVPVYRTNSGCQAPFLVEIGEQPKKGYPTRISLFLLAMKSKPGQWYLPYLSFLFYHAGGSKEQTLPGRLRPK
jgi:hypothetical protein